MEQGMTGTGDLKARMEALYEQARGAMRPVEEARQEAAAKLADLQNQLAEIQARTYVGAAGPEGDDERVVAEVDGNGELIRVEISPYGMRDFDAGQLSIACTEAIAAARDRLAAAFQERLPMTAQTSGEGMPELLDMGEIFRHAKEMAWRR
jgi:DNA-binding protein YbaB